jgi:hypothetical protein
MHFSALIPLAFFGFLGVFSVCLAILAWREELGGALILLGIGLIATLAYPAAIDFENWLERNMSSDPAQRLPRIPIGVYDVLFLGGGLFASWRIASRVNPLASIAVALVLWGIAGAAARRRAADLAAAASKKKL